MNISTAQSPAAAPLSPRKVSPWFTYGVLFTLLWCLLTKGEVGSWVIGAWVIPAATWCALRLFHPARATAESGEPRRAIRLKALLGFVPFFLWQSLRGGWDSAVLAIVPGKRVRQGFIHFRTALPAGRPRLYLVHVVSLLPGTVTADWQGERLFIHVLDTHADNHAALRECETQIAALFGVGHADLARDANEETL